MNFKKRVNGSWTDTPHYIHKTDTDILTTLPVVVYPNDTTATVGLKGQTVQNGAPTPDIPVDVAGCGTKTENLFDIDNVIKNYYLKNGVPTPYNIGGYVLSDYIPIASNTATISAKITISTYSGAHWAVYDENKTFIRGGIAFDAHGSGIKVRDVDTSGAAFIRVDYALESFTDCMLNLGSTPLPYEPYGYKLPMASRTENLFDIDNVIENYYLKNGVPTPYNIGGYVLSDYIPIASNTATISAKVTALNDSGAHWAVYDGNKSFIRGGLAFTARPVSTVKVMNTSGAAFIRVDYALESFTDCMLNLGSTPLSYKPYHRIATNIYLGEVETTRRIKKLVLTGEENWNLNNNKLMFYRKPFETFSYESVVCTHYINAKSFTEVFDTTNSIAIITTGIYVNSGHTNVADFKSYLAAQYAAGTPVTVWYVLANEKTAVVNEPLMKIGNYSDTVPNITIPVTAGGDMLSVDTTVQPSGIAINYKGWHNAKCKEYSYNMTIADWESASISQMENHTIQELQGGNWV